MIMEKKQMYVADVNVVFGKEEEPLIKNIDAIVLPALKSNLVHDSSEKTKYFFADVDIREFDDEYVLSGLLIKDTILEIKSEYSYQSGLQKINKRVKSAPYSLFMLYLKNHRMILVKNQDGSPDIRGFSAAFKNIVKKYVRGYNEKIRNDDEITDKEYMKYPYVHASGIKTAQSVRQALKDVEKITEMTMALYPLNSEWDMENVIGGIDDSIRRVVGSKRGKLTFSSPGNIEGVAKVLESTEGMVKTSLKVKYKEGAANNRKKGTIKDDEISDVSIIDLYAELSEAYEEINNMKQEIVAMNVTSENNLLDYQEFVNRRKLR